MKNHKRDQKMLVEAYTDIINEVSQRWIQNKLSQPLADTGYNKERQQRVGAKADQRILDKTGIPAFVNGNGIFIELLDLAPDSHAIRGKINAIVVDQPRYPAEKAASYSDRVQIEYSFNNDYTKVELKVVQGNPSGRISFGDRRAANQFLTKLNQLAQEQRIQEWRTIKVTQLNILNSDYAYGNNPGMDRSQIAEIDRTQRSKQSNPIQPTQA